MRHFLLILVACGTALSFPAHTQEKKEPAPPPISPFPTLPQKILFKLPTPNRALLDGNLEAYYQPTISKRPESGMYGYVRSTENGPNPQLFDIFHEGIDIKPTQLNSRGEPLDDVMASADGIVVYVNDEARRSNYGRYILIEHRAAEFTAYTLYAHLAKAIAPAGKIIKQGEIIGKMGYTGRGISKERAHLHFEIDFLANLDFPIWFSTQADYNPRDPNFHGIFNGLNLIGVDPSPILKKGESKTEVGLQELLEKESPVYTIRVPAGNDYFCWQRRFPSLVEGGVTPDQEMPKSWEIDFTASGIPIRFRRAKEECSKPELVKFDYLRGPQESLTHGYVKRTGDKSAEITKQGFKWFSLITSIPGAN